MDAKLAQIYGTNQADEADVEKLAQAELAEKLAAANEEEVDPSKLSDDDAEELARQVLSGDEGEEVSEETEEEEAPHGDAPDEEAQEKLAEADYLGRVMAHAFVNERTSIEKEASPYSEGYARTFGKKGLAGLKAGAGKHLKNLGGKAKALGGKMKEHAGKGATKAKETAGKVDAHMKNHSKKYMGGAAATAGGAGFAAGRKSKKASAEETEQLSALDTLAVARAREILEAHGVGVEEPEKTASLSEEQAESLASAVEARAQALLEAEGYTFEGAEEE